MDTHDTAWRRVCAFHGHSCPGLAKGFRMAREAMRILDICRAAHDEELVCITETDACGVDAVQALLGCTLGKGNLIIKPRGKNAMTFYRRDTGRAIRLLWRHIFTTDLPRDEKIAVIFTESCDSLITVTECTDPRPPRALISASIPCCSCGELTSEVMLRPYQGGLYCLDCVPQHSRILLP